MEKSQSIADLSFKVLHKPTKEPTKELWFAVLRQALEDAFTYSGANIAGYERQAARDFVKERNKDFDIVCENAGFNPDYIWNKVDKFKERSYVWQTYLRSM